MIDESFMQRIRDVLATLTPREEQVLRMRYGVGEVPADEACARLMLDLFGDAPSPPHRPHRPPHREAAVLTAAAVRSREKASRRAMIWLLRSANPSLPWRAIGEAFGISGARARDLERYAYDDIHGEMKKLTVRPVVRISIGTEGEFRGTFQAEPTWQARLRAAGALGDSTAGRLEHAWDDVAVDHLDAGGTSYKATVDGLQPNGTRLRRGDR